MPMLNSRREASPMSKTSRLAFYDGSAQDWERALYAFLGEKERRSGSRPSASTARMQVYKGCATSPLPFLAPSAREDEGLIHVTRLPSFSVSPPPPIRRTASR